MNKLLKRKKSKTFLSMLEKMSVHSIRENVLTDYRITTIFPVVTVSLMLFALSLRANLRINVSGSTCGGVQQVGGLTAEIR
jgi:hypothetical protein